MAKRQEPDLRRAVLADGAKRGRLPTAGDDSFPWIVNPLRESAKHDGTRVGIDLGEGLRWEELPKG